MSVLITITVGQSSMQFFTSLLFQNDRIEGMMPHFLFLTFLQNSTILDFYLISNFLTANRKC